MKKQKPLPLKSINSTLIAPCGMNCRLCRPYVREKKTCPGCNGDDTFKSKACSTCKIKNCEIRVLHNIKFCFQCEQFPCHHIIHIDNRYRTKYGMSMIENLKYIEKFGLEEFINNEKKKWACPSCGEVICVHKENCTYCGHKWKD